MQKKFLFYAIALFTLALGFSACSDSKDENPITEDKVDLTEITLFAIDASYGTINKETKTIDVILPAHTAVTNLMPVVRVHEGSTVSPATAEIIDFSSPVIYTVTDPSQKETQYTVNVTVTKGDECTIDQLKFEGANNLARINQETGEITASIPYSIDVTKLKIATLKSLAGTFSPDIRQPTDYTQPVTVKVTSEDGTNTKTYTIKVDRVKDKSALIQHMTFPDITQPVEVIVRQSQIDVKIISETPVDITALKPTVFFKGVSVTPASGEVQDFTNPVTYTVQAEDETISKSYSVVVKVVEPDPVVSIKPSIIKTGDEITITGSLYGNTATKATLVSLSGPQTYELPITSSATGQIVVKVPSTPGVPNGYYFLRVDFADGRMFMFQRDFVIKK